MEIPLRAVFEKRTIEDLALYIAEFRLSARPPTRSSNCSRSWKPYPKPVVLLRTADFAPQRTSGFLKGLLNTPDL